MFSVTEILQFMVLVTGLLDATKYKFISQKISRYKSSKEQSRKMLNITIIKNIVLLIWAYRFLHDYAITWSCIFALYTCSEAVYYGYLYYPYKNNKKKGWKRPSLIKYILHSFTPNKYAKKL